MIPVVSVTPIIIRRTEIRFYILVAVNLDAAIPTKLWKYIEIVGENHEIQ